MQLQEFRTLNTSDVVADQLREAILKGVYKPGDRLIETELAERFSVSRGPVREAVRVLAAEGLVQLRKNRGAVVSAPSPDDVLEVYATRMALGSLAVEHSALTNLSDGSHVRRLTRLLKRMENPSVQADRRRMVDADLAFQEAVVATANLPRISDMFAQTDTDIRFFVQALGLEYGHVDHVSLIARHQVLIDKMIDGDVDGAIAAWRTHIQLAVSDCMPSFASGSGSPFERPQMLRLFNLTRLIPHDEKGA